MKMCINGICSQLFPAQRVLSISTGQGMLAFRGASIPGTMVGTSQQQHLNFNAYYLHATSFAAHWKIAIGNRGSFSPSLCSLLDKSGPNVADCHTLSLVSVYIQYIDIQNTNQLSWTINFLQKEIWGKTRKVALGQSAPTPSLRPPPHSFACYVLHPERLLLEI